MNTTVIDTLRLSDRLKEAGFEPLRAEGLARALGDELSDRLVTKVDLDEAIRPLNARLDAVELGIQALDRKFEARFETVDGKFVTIDQRFEAIDQRFEAVDRRFDAVDRRFDAVDQRFESTDAKIDSLQREFNGKFNMLLGTVILGFTLLAGLGGYNAVSQQVAGSPTPVAPGDVTAQ